MHWDQTKQSLAYISSTLLHGVCMLQVASLWKVFERMDMLACRCGVPGAKGQPSQRQTLPPRPASRLGMQQVIGKAAGLLPATHPTSGVAHPDQLLADLAG